MDREKPVKIVLGCYDQEPHDYHKEKMGDWKNWILSDIKPRFSGIEEIDVRSIPYKDVTALYASHVLEHVKYDEVMDTLKHWHDVLEPGGWLHINVPDIEWGLDQLMKINCGDKTDSWYFHSRDKVMQIFNGTMDSDEDTHRSWFTVEKLYKMLREAGFKNVDVRNEYEAHDMVCVLADCKK